MRIGVFIVLNLVLAALTAGAGENLPELKLGTNVYHKVVVLSVTPTDVIFTSDMGMANVKLKNLDPAVREQFLHPAPVSAPSPKPKEADALHPVSVAAAVPVVPSVDHTNIKTVMDDAIDRVKTIVNQPVKQLAVTPDMEVATYKPGWFREGAARPNFDTVDVRATQETGYGQHPYVTSDLNPGIVFMGAELEFNPMIKYFYVDRMLPKKKLTDEEMQEINRLYRIIGKCDESLK
jgi:hypothetical protein